MGFINDTLNFNTQYIFKTLIISSLLIVCRLSLFTDLRIPEAKVRIGQGRVHWKIISQGPVFFINTIPAFALCHRKKNGKQVRMFVYWGRYQQGKVKQFSSIFVLYKTQFCIEIVVNSFIHYLGITKSPYTHGLHSWEQIKIPRPFKVNF